MDDPFHAGERAIQETTGERDTALVNGRLIAGQIPEPARPFVAKQHYCLLGWSSPERDLWAAFLAGPQGFARTDEKGEILSLGLSDENGALTLIPPLAALRQGDHLGVLFIELQTRRRLRVNGRVALRTDEEITVEIDRAYALCPKYIQRRRFDERKSASATADLREGQKLSDDLIGWIKAADAFFVASAHPEGPADVSHRGGKRGFVRLERETLRIPDYPGNSMFNTLGNLALNPRAGLVFIDFAANRQLQLTGDVHLDLAADEADGETGGSGRWWEFVPHRWIVSPLNRNFDWEFIDESPFNP